jgi:hypothetical protein
MRVDARVIAMLEIDEGSLPIVWDADFLGGRVRTTVKGQPVND